MSHKLPRNVFFFSLYSTCVLNYVHISNAFLISKNFSLPETLNLTHYRVPLIRLKYTNSTLFEYSESARISTLQHGQLRTDGRSLARSTIEERYYYWNKSLNTILESGTTQSLILCALPFDSDHWCTTSHLQITNRSDC